MQCSTEQGSAVQQCYRQRSNRRKMFAFVENVQALLQWIFHIVLLPLVVTWRLVRQRIHLLRLAERMPGPSAYPLFGNALDAKSFKPTDMFSHFLKYNEIYGKTLRYYLGPLLFVYTRELKDIEMLLSSQKYTEKGFLYKVLNLWLGTGLVTSGGAKWRSRRKALTPAFHFKIVDQFVQVFNSCGDEFVQQLRKRADDTAFNVYPFAELLTLDIICEAVMGVKINAQTESYSSYVKTVRQVSSMTIDRVFKPWYFPDFIFLNSPSGREYKKLLKILHGTTQKVIEERRQELEQIWAGKTFMNVDELGRRRRIAFLDLLLWNARDGSLSDADIREEVETFMFAGHDTTATALAFTMLLLSRHADAQEKILKELESVFDPEQPTELSLQKLSELKYLEMVVKESLRIYTPVPLFNRSNPEDTALVSGHVMPSGCSITISPYGMHRDPDVFPEPERFLPERFTPEESARRHPYAYIPFSAGPRNCIGQRFAMMELKSTLAKVVWNFRLLPAPDFEPELSWELTLQSVNGIHVRLQERRLN